MREAEALNRLRESWNPKWVEFLASVSMTPEQAEKLPRHERTKLNAEFLCATMGSKK